MQTTDRIRQILSGAALFKGLDPEQIDQIAERVTVASFAPGHTIIQEGQRGHPLYIIVSGMLEVVLSKSLPGTGMERGTRIRLSQVTAGDCIGDYALIDHQPAAASVVTVSPCVLMQISPTDFETIIAASDHLAKTVYHNMLLMLVTRARKGIRELDICF